jgi:hypothetical protein
MDAREPEPKPGAEPSPAVARAMGVFRAREGERILAALVDAVERWGAEEDGIPADAWDEYRKALAWLGRPEPRTPAWARDHDDAGPEEPIGPPDPDFGS